MGRSPNDDFAYALAFESDLASIHGFQGLLSRATGDHLAGIHLVTSSEFGGSLPRVALPSVLRNAIDRTIKILDRARPKVSHSEPTAPGPIAAQIAVAAKEVHREMLPSMLPSIAGYSIGAFCVPVENIGGDVYAVQSSSDGGPIRFLLADAMGHGPGAALTAARLLGMFQLSAELGCNLSSLLRAFNVRLVRARCQGIRFVTAFLGELTPSTGVVQYASAGHGPVIHRGRASIQCDQLHVSGPPLGIDETSVYDSESLIELVPGDGLLVPSDGVFEQPCRSETSFGVERLCGILAREAATGAIDASSVCRSVDAQMREVCGGPQDWRDDVSVLCIARNGQ